MGYIYNTYGVETVRSVAITLFDLFSSKVDEWCVYETMLSNLYYLA